MAPKKEKVKMKLHDFLADEATGSWADEMDSMPTAPGQFEDIAGGYKRSGGFGARGDAAGGAFGGDRDRPPRPDVPFPTEPPYTAFVGNLSFDCSQDEIRDFLTNEGITVSSVRMVNGFDGKPKGFCYAEFPEPDMLKKALDLSGQQLAGRMVRISVAEPPRADAAGRSAGDWTRSGPLAPMAGGRDAGRPGMMRNDRASSGGPPVDSGRDWGDARGSKFAPAAPPSPSMGSRAAFGDRREPSSARIAGGFSRDRDASGASAAAAAAGAPVDVDWSAARGGRFTPSQQPSTQPAPFERKPSGFIERTTSGPGEARDWRARASPPVGTPTESPSASPAPPAAPAERKKLQLAARSTSSASAADSPNDTNSPAGAARSSIFGGAAPVNTAAREAAVVERRNKERAEAEEKRKAELAAARLAAEKPAANPFGDAKPVDVSAREKEIEEKLAKDKEELAKRMKEAKIASSAPSSSSNDGDAASNSGASASVNGAKAPATTPANQKREWRRSASGGAPSAGHSATGAGTRSPSHASQNSPTIPAAASMPTENGKTAPVLPRQFSKNAGARKEGFSYANISAAKAAAAQQPPASPNPQPASPKISAAATLGEEVTSAQ